MKPYVGAGGSVLAALGLLGNAHAVDCALKQLARVDLAVGEQIVLPVRVQGHDLRMILNTAGAYNLISSEAVDALKLHRRSLNTYSSLSIYIGSEKAKESVFLDAADIGNAHVRRLVFVVDPPSDQQEGSWRPQGDISASLSMSAFGAFDVELDIAHRLLALYSPHCGGPPVYWSDTAAEMPLYLGGMGELYFPVELEGKVVEATVSTQAPNSALDEMASRKLYGFDRHSPGIELRRGADGKPEPYYKAMKITAKGLEVANADVTLKQEWSACRLSESNSRERAIGFTGCLGRYPLTLGRDVLDKLHLYFAIKEGVVYYTLSDATRPASSPAPPPPSATPTPSR